MISAHERHCKTIEPYTLIATDLEKRIPSFNKRLEAYPAVTGHLFPTAEGERACRQLSSTAKSFETSIPKVVKTMKSLLSPIESYLRMLTQTHLSIDVFARLVSEEANKVILLGMISGNLLGEVLDTLSAVSDETLLVARRAPSASLVPPDIFAFYGIEMAELRMDLRKLKAAIDSTHVTYHKDQVHESLCPRCLARTACEMADLN